MSIDDEGAILKLSAEHQALLIMLDRLVQLPTLKMHIPELRMSDVGTQGIRTAQHAEAAFQSSHRL